MADFEKEVKDVEAGEGASESDSSNGRSSGKPSKRDRDKRKGNQWKVPGARSGYSKATKESKRNLPDNAIKTAIQKGFAAYDESVYDVTINEPVPYLGAGYCNDYDKSVNLTNYAYGTPMANADVYARSIPDSEGALMCNPPALANLEFMPTMGASSNDNQDPINQCAQTMYNYISRVQHGGQIVTKYSKLDVPIYLFAISNIILVARCIEWICKCGLKQLTLASVLPMVYFGAIGLTKTTRDNPLGAYNDINSDPKHWNGVLTHINVKLQQLIIPDGLPIMEQWTSLIQNMYADDEDLDHASLFTFFPNGFWWFDEDYSEMGPGLRFLKLSDLRTSQGKSNLGGQWELEDLVELFETMITLVVDNSDICHQIGADIQTAYGTDAFWSPMVYISSDMADQRAFNPVVYSKDVLIAINNSKIIPAAGIEPWVYHYEIPGQPNARLVRDNKNKEIRVEDSKDSLSIDENKEIPYITPTTVIGRGQSKNGALRKSFNNAVTVDVPDTVRMFGRPQLELGSWPVHSAAINPTLKFDSRPTKHDMACALKFHPISGYINSLDGTDTAPDLHHVYLDFGTCFGTELITMIKVAWVDPRATGNPNQKWHIASSSTNVFDASTFNFADDVFMPAILDDFRYGPRYTILKNVELQDNRVVKMNVWLETGDRIVEQSADYPQAKMYFEGFTRYNWGAETNAKATGLFTASQRKTIG